MISQILTQEKNFQKKITMDNDIEKTNINVIYDK